ncbi:UNVERIFIED_CONTAM: hypothetical protein PYX00_003318 [Menopon gallinae]|uniref:Uncharacterized protein n=1 Tax=Menopon gallinae TaxID=328185 RepID=A0AAW2I0W9_9NEOP
MEAVRKPRSQNEQHPQAVPSIEENPQDVPFSGQRLLRREGGLRQADGSAIAMGQETLKETLSVFVTII